jgi:hypothetical protein
VHNQVVNPGQYTVKPDLYTVKPDQYFVNSHPLNRHSRFRGNPGRLATGCGLAPRFRGGDEEEGRVLKRGCGWRRREQGTDESQGSEGQAILGQMLQLSL